MQGFFRRFMWDSDGLMPGSGPGYPYPGIGVAGMHGIGDRTFAMNLQCVA